jgi:uncharacterized protein YidB (DUF937 family)
VGIQDIINQFGGQQAAMEQIHRLFGGQGMPGVVSKLTQSGMGKQVQSWIGMGENESVSGQQMKQAMDPGALQDMAQKTGMSPDQISDHVAQVLPHLLDQATPEGTMPEGGSAMTKGMNALKGMFNR